MGGNFTIYLPILGFLLKFAGEELRLPKGRRMLRRVFM